jgi:hypothetical protein
MIDLGEEEAKLLVSEANRRLGPNPLFPVD